MNGLPGGKKLTIYLAVSMQYRRATDRRRDGHLVTIAWRRANAVRPPTMNVINAILLCFKLSRRKDQVAVSGDHLNLDTQQL